VSFELEKVNYSITCIFNGRQCGTNYVKSYDEAFQLLNEYNNSYELEWEIDDTDITLKNGKYFMLKQKFRDIDFILSDLNYCDILPGIFTNIKTKLDKQKQEEEVAKMIAEEDKAREEYLASGKTLLLCRNGRM